MRTVDAPVVGSEVRVEPQDRPGILVNGLPADLAHVAKEDVRVDLAAGDDRSFVVEHVLGTLGLCGVTAAKVTGVREEWSFERPEHRFCYSRGWTPASVVGHPAGLPNPDMANAVAEAGVEAGDPEPRATVTEPVSYEANGGRIELRPREYGAGTRFEVEYEGATTTAEVDPRGENDPELVEAVTNATTPYLTTEPEEAVTHAVADLVSDVLVLGGLDDLVVDAELGGAYHALTVGAARRAHERGVVERRGD